jgi:anthranilate/para-aminobenzoate synthase component I
MYAYYEQPLRHGHSQNDVNVTHVCRHADAVLSFADRLVVLDHHEQHVYMLAIHDNTPRVRHSAEAWLTHACTALKSLASLPAPDITSGADVAASNARVQAQNVCLDSAPLSGGVNSAKDTLAISQECPVVNVAVSWAIAFPSNGMQPGVGAVPDAGDVGVGACLHAQSACCPELQPAAQTVTNGVAGGEQSNHSSKKPIRANGRDCHEPFMLLHEQLQHGSGVPPATVDGAAPDSTSEGLGRDLSVEPEQRGKEQRKLHNGANEQAPQHISGTSRECLTGAPMIEGNSFQLARSKSQYLKDIDRCMEALHEGNSYEICLTNSLHCRVGNWDAWDFYQVLRKANPAPYAAWLHCGEVCTVCSYICKDMLPLCVFGLYFQKHPALWL